MFDPYFPNPALFIRFFIVRKSSISTESILLHRQVNLHLQCVWNLCIAFFFYCYHIFSSIRAHPSLASIPMSKINLSVMSIDTYNFPASNDFLWLSGSVLKLFTWFLEDLGLVGSQISRYLIFVHTPPGSLPANFFLVLKANQIPSSFRDFFHIRHFPWKSSSLQVSFRKSLSKGILSQASPTPIS